MNKEEFKMEKEVSVTVNGKVFRYRVANFNTDRTILDLIEKGLFTLQGIRRESHEN